MKAHLVTSEAPIMDGFPVTGVCDFPIQHCQIVYMWDALAMGPIAMSTLICCQKCWGRLRSFPTDQRYVYGCIEAKGNSAREEYREP